MHRSVDRQTIGGVKLATGGEAGALCVSAI
jgi:hypothetical protein